MITNSPAPNAGNRSTPGNVNGSNGLWVILNSPMIVTRTNGASTIDQEELGGVPDELAAAHVQQRERPDHGERHDPSQELVLAQAGKKYAE